MQKILFKNVFSPKSQAGNVLNLSLIFQQISAWRPYKLGPYKKKKCSLLIEMQSFNNMRPLESLFFSLKAADVRRQYYRKSLWRLRKVGLFFRQL